MYIHVGVCVRMGTRQSCEAPQVIDLMWFECGGEILGSERYKFWWRHGVWETWEWRNQSKLSMKMSQEIKLLCMLIKHKENWRKEISFPGSGYHLFPPVYSYLRPLCSTSKNIVLFLGDKDPCAIVWSYKWFKLVRILIAMRWLYYLLLIRGL